MNFTIEDHKECPGKVIKIREGRFSTVRYVINGGIGFILVNPFLPPDKGCSHFISFDNAMAMLFADVENHIGLTLRVKHDIMSSQ